MTDYICIVLPFPPSMNRIWRNNARTHKSGHYLQWQREAGWQLQAQRPPAIAGPYDLSITFGRPDRRQRDLDNLGKAISDLLKAHGVIESDHLCQRLEMAWCRTGETKGALVEVRAAS